MANYMEWKMMGSRKIMKKGIVPHKQLVTLACSSAMTSTSILKCKKIIPHDQGDSPSGKKTKTSTVTSEAPVTVKENISVSEEHFELSHTGSPPTNTAMSSTSKIQQFSVEKKSVSVSVRPHYRSKGIQSAPSSEDKCSSPIRFAQV